MSVLNAAAQKLISIIQKSDLQEIIPVAILETMSNEWLFDDGDRMFMQQALEQAKKAAHDGEVPVGAVVVRDGAVIAKAGNCRRDKNDPTGHAELVALRQAARVCGDWRLEDCTLYVTLEPCPMCVSACRQARLDLVVWGAADPVAGACGSVLDLAADPRLGHPLAQRGGLQAQSCGDLLREFFAKRRRSS